MGKGFVVFVMVPFIFFSTIYIAGITFYNDSLTYKTGDCKEDYYVVKYGKMEDHHNGEPTYKTSYVRNGHRKVSCD